MRRSQDRRSAASTTRSDDSQDHPQRRLVAAIRIAAYVSNEAHQLFTEILALEQPHEGARRRG